MKPIKSDFPLRQYAFTFVGIVVSVVLPILRRMLPSLLYSAANPAWKTYAIVGLFSAVTAVLVVAYGGDQVSTWKWHTAVLAGYAWDATLQKIVHG